jgi:hypothetical protein
VKVLLGVLTVIGLPVLLADLKDAAVSRWVARQLIRRAVLRLPEQEQARWGEEWLRHAEDVPGLILPLARAVQIFSRAGSWGRMLRGAPSRSEVVKARIRAAWQKLRSRPEASSQESPAEPVAATVEAQPAIATAVALSATVSVGVSDAGPKGVPSSALRSQKGFENWLAYRQREDEDWLAQWQREDEELRAECMRGFDAWLWMERSNRKAR